jgi:hypothetical protein
MVVTNYFDAKTVTPSDSASIPVTNGIYVGVAGDVVVLTQGGTQQTFKTLNAGVIHPIKVSKILATGTTATNILAIY